MPKVLNRSVSINKMKVEKDFDLLVVYSDPNIKTFFGTQFSNFWNKKKTIGYFYLQKDFYN